MVSYIVGQLVDFHPYCGGQIPSNNLIGVMQLAFTMAIVLELCRNTQVEGELTTAQEIS